jgi:predicted  nucleic acid-binding Zn-ribbon protein
MTKEEAKEYIEEIKKLEIEINQLRNQKANNMNLMEICDKLARLKSLYAEHRILSDKIKMIERLA